MKMYKVFINLVLIALSVSTVYATDNEYVKQATQIMQDSSNLEAYVAQSYANGDISDAKLAQYKKRSVEQYRELSSDVTALEKELYGLKLSLSDYTLENNESNTNYKIDNHYLYKAFSQLTKEENKKILSKGAQKLSFKSPVIQKRYEELLDNYFEIKESLAFVKDTKKRIHDDIDLISDIRIKTRNRDFFTKGGFLGYVNTWKEGFTQIEYKVNLPFMLKSTVLAFIVFGIYIFSSLMFYLLFKHVKTKFSQARFLLGRIAFTIRILFNIFIAFILATFLGELFSAGDYFYVSYMLCVYIIVKNTMMLVFGFVKTNVLKKAYFWFNIYVMILILLMLIAGVDFFSAVTIINPAFGYKGNEVICFVLSLILLLAAVNFYLKLSLYVREKKVAKLLTLAMIVLALAYSLITFAGLNNFATGITVNIIQIFITISILYSIYKLMVTLLYYVSILKSSGVVDKGTLVKKLKSKEYETVFEYWARILIKNLFVFVSILASLAILGVPYQEMYDFFYAMFFTGIKISGSNYFAVFDIVKCSVVLIIGLIVTRFVRDIFSKNILPYTNIDQGTQKAISSIVWYFCMLIALVFFIASLGISGTTLAFVISGLSVGIGFALQDLIKNFFAGFVLLIERPIKIGDWIHLENDIYEIKKIGLRSTIVENYSLSTKIIPNNELVAKEVQNETFNFVTRMDVSIKVKLDEDIKRIPDMLIDVANVHERVLNTPKPFVTFEGYGKYAYEFTLRAYCPRVYRLTIQSSLHQAIVDRLIMEDITIPMNTSKIILDKSSESTNIN